MERFIDALGRLEEQGDPAELAALFDDDAEIQNPVLHAPERGCEGAVRFWAEYQHSFGRVRSRFRHVLMAPTTASSSGRATARCGPARRSATRA